LLQVLVVVVVMVVVVVVVVVFVVVVEQVQFQTYHQVVAELPLPYFNKKAYLYYLKIRM
jgi:hypothetical protein